VKPDLGRRFAPRWFGRPPHMSGEDFAIWGRWWPAHDRLFTSVFGAVDEAHAGMWTRLTQKRADVVLEAASGWTILELRAHAQLNAVGRLLGYGLLWGKDHPDGRPVELLLVTDVADADVRELAGVSGIRYEVA
jgi:hypothetical protein